MSDSRGVAQWDAIADMLYRQKDELSAKYASLTDSAKRKGSLELDPNFKMPKGMVKVDIHLQPGGYCLDYGDDDVLAGAFYECGDNLYAKGRGVGTSESKGEVGIRFLKERYPDFTPYSVLDIGCSAGSSTVPYAKAFPKADVHGIDVGPAILRYAHARAEAMGACVHFHQRDAESTRFDDESFDLVTSHNAMHEFPQRTTERMMEESFRLLKSGGVAMHLDINIRFNEYDPWMKFHRGWDQTNNNEPYWRVYATNNPAEMLCATGFPEDTVWQGKFQQLDKSLRWFIATARKA